MEPYPTPNIIAQDLKPILEAVAFMDVFFFGGWNYNPVAAARRFPDRDLFYREQRKVAKRFCGERGIRCDFGA
jgi:hypothetical protein